MISIEARPAYREHVMVGCDSLRDDTIPQEDRNAK